MLLKNIFFYDRGIFLSKITFTYLLTFNNFILVIFYLLEVCDLNLLGIVLHHINQLRNDRLIKQYKGLSCDHEQISLNLVFGKRSSFCVVLLNST